MQIPSTNSKNLNIQNENKLFIDELMSKGILYKWADVTNYVINNRFAIDESCINQLKFPNYIGTKTEEQYEFEAKIIDYSFDNEKGNSIILKYGLINKNTSIE